MLLFDLDDIFPQPSTPGIIVFFFFFFFFIYSNKSKVGVLSKTSIEHGGRSGGHRTF